MPGIQLVDLRVLFYSLPQQLCGVGTITVSLTPEETEAQREGTCLSSPNQEIVELTFGRGPFLTPKPVPHSEPPEPSLEGLWSVFRSLGGQGP